MENYLSVIASHPVTISYHQRDCDQVKKDRKMPHNGGRNLIWGGDEERDLCVLEFLIVIID